MQRSSLIRIALMGALAILPALPAQADAGQGLPGPTGNAENSPRACGVLAGTGAVRQDEWDGSAFAVREGAPLIWYPAQGAPRRAVLHIVQDNDRWSYVTVRMDGHDYLLTRASNDAAGMVMKPAGFQTPRMPAYARWITALFREEGQPEDAWYGVSPLLKVSLANGCPSVQDQGSSPF